MSDEQKLQLLKEANDTNLQLIIKVNEQQEEIERLQDEYDNMVQEYDYLISNIRDYLNCCQYFLQTQEENNECIANMIHDFENKENEDE